jgi:hypothetical protein
MFFRKSTQPVQDDKQIATLTKTVEQLEAQIKRMRDEAECAKLKDIATSNFAIDFDIMRVFAIERNMHNGAICTIVGHFIAEPVAFTDGNVASKEGTREWYMYCSQEQHEKLVAEFEAYKKKSKK